jgi:hypothetical protein
VPARVTEASGEELDANFVEELHAGRAASVDDSLSAALETPAA